MPINPLRTHGFSRSKPALENAKPKLIDFPGLQALKERLSQIQLQGPRGKSLYAIWNASYRLGENRIDPEKIAYNDQNSFLAPFYYWRHGYKTITDVGQGVHGMSNQEYTEFWIRAVASRIDAPVFLPIVFRSLTLT